MFFYKNLYIIKSDILIWQCVTLLCFILLTVTTLASETKYKYDDNGKLKDEYEVNDTGKPDGIWKSYFLDGTLKGTATYKNGILHGPYIRYHANGKKAVSANYRNGVLHGTRITFNLEGISIKKTLYINGEISEKTSSKKAPPSADPQDNITEKHPTENDPFIFPNPAVKDNPAIKKPDLLPEKATPEPKKSAADSHAPVKFLKNQRFDPRIFTLTPDQMSHIFHEIKEIKLKPVGSSGNFPSSIVKRIKDEKLQKDREEALRTLMKFRAICGLPWRDLSLDQSYTGYAEAGAALMSACKQLSHTPQCPPGYPGQLYQLGYKGTSSSNIYASSDSKFSLSDTIYLYMNDSDPVNISRLGHRRWCLNPWMKSTGFGRSGNYSAMWAMDSIRTNVNFDMIPFPPRGLTPVNMFKSDWAWNVSFNTQLVTCPSKKEISVRVFNARFIPTSGKFEKEGAALQIEAINVETTNFGVPLCVIFRPVGIQVVSGASYAVEIDGLTAKNGRNIPVRYWVMFCDKIK